MNEGILQRQVALVSYGNKFLRGKLTLDEFFRHGVFYGKRLLFRAPGENGLLADDFTLWLEILRELGAQRLSLHRAAQFDASAKHARDGGCLVIVAHYAGHCQLWVCGDEQATWWNHPALPNDPYQMTSDVPGAAYYGGAIDSYWCVQEIQGDLPVPDTNWKALAADIAKDLGLTVKQAKVKPFFAHMHDAPDWAKFPLFPFANHAPLPHQLLTVLTDAQRAFANDTNCKNENSFFQHLSEEEAARHIQWGQRLDQWTVNLQLRCANDYQRGTATVAEPVEAPAFVPPADNQARIRATAKNQARRDKRAAKAAIAAKATEAVKPAMEAAEAPAGRWLKACGFAVLLGLLSLLLLGLCHLIAAHAWLSLVLGLPFAIYVWSSEKKE